MAFIHSLLEEYFSCVNTNFSFFFSFFFLFYFSLWVQGTLSVLTGGLRPTFLSDCNPSPATWTPGTPSVCLNEVDDEARRSFPCGHCSFSTFVLERRSGVWCGRERSQRGKKMSFGSFSYTQILWVMKDLACCSFRCFSAG
jgi:hypothetical protein